MRIGKKSPLRHTGTNEGHELMRREQHIKAHGGDVVAAGYEEETEEKEKQYEFKVPTIEEKKKLIKIWIEQDAVDKDFWKKAGWTDDKTGEWVDANREDYFKKDNKWYYKRPRDGKEFELKETSSRYKELIEEEIRIGNKLYFGEEEKFKERQQDFSIALASWRKKYDEKYGKNYKGSIDLYYITRHTKEEEWVNKNYPEFSDEKVDEFSKFAPSP